MKKKVTRLIAALLVLLMIGSICAVSFAAAPDTLDASTIVFGGNDAFFEYKNGSSYEALTISRYTIGDHRVYATGINKNIATTGTYSAQESLTTDAGVKKILQYGFPINTPESSELQSHFPGLTNSQMSYATQAAIFAWVGGQSDAPASLWKTYASDTSAIRAVSTEQAKTFAYFEYLLGHAADSAPRTPTITSADGMTKDLYLELNGANFSALSDKALGVTVSKCSEPFTYTVTPSSVNVTRGDFNDADKVMLGLSISQSAYNALTDAQKADMKITVSADDYGTNAEINFYKAADTASNLVRVAKLAANKQTVSVTVKLACKGTYNTPFDLSKTDAVSQSTPVAGATIGIYTDSACATAPVKTGVTDANGKFRVTGLVGTTPSISYYFKEITAPSGYILNPNIYTFRVNETGGLEAGSATSFTNAPNNATNKAFSFTKTSTTGTPLQNAYVAIYAPGELTTPLFQDASDAAGKISVPAGTLAVGNYVYKETFAPSGYVLDTTAHTLTVSNDGTVTGENNLTITNTPSGGGGGTGINEPFYIEKVDADNAGKYLSGALFRIYDSNSNVVKNGETNTNGRLLIDQNTLPAGTFTIYEEIAPSGYTKNTTPVTITVMTTGAVRGTTDGILRITNKASSTVPNALGVNAPVVQVLERESRQPVPGFTLSFQGPQNYNIVTDASGKASLTSAPDGTYKYKTTAAPATFACNTEEYSMTKTGNTATGTLIIYVDYIKVAYKKVDSKDESKVLSGAKFTLYDASYNEVISATTGNDGMAAFIKIRPGKYTVKETAAPKGYTPDNQVYSFEITPQSANGPALTIKNSKAVQTGHDNPYLLICGGAAVILFCFGAWAVIRKAMRKKAREKDAADAHAQDESKS